MELPERKFTARDVGREPGMGRQTGGQVDGQTGRQMGGWMGGHGPGRAHCMALGKDGGCPSHSPGTWAFSAKMGTFPSKPGWSVTPEDPDPSEPHVLSGSWGWWVLAETPPVPGAPSPSSAAWPDPRASGHPWVRSGTWPVPPQSWGASLYKSPLTMSQALSLQKQPAARVLVISPGLRPGHQRALLRGPGGPAEGRFTQVQPG